MYQFILRRLALTIPSLFVIALITFVVMHAVPGDIVDMMLGTLGEVTPEQEAEMRKLYGLDQPVLVQFGNWLAGIAQGSMGYSLRTGRPVWADITSRLGITYELTLLSLAVGLVIGIPAGIISAVTRSKVVDGVTRVLSLFGLSLPNFWTGTLLILGMSYFFQWLPSLEFIPFFENPWENLKILVLPSVALGLGVAAVAARTLRSAMLEVYEQEHIKTARAKGLSERRVAVIHALKNALIPVTTVVGIQVGYLLGGAVILEEVFSLPGSGRLMLNAIYQRDYPLVQGTVLVFAATFVLVNLFVDVLYAALDPRIRYD